MAIRPCENQFYNCPFGFEDQHHLYKLADADTPLKRIYAKLGCNIIDLCRCIHQELEATVGWLPYPDEGVMVDSINQEVDAGHLTLSATKQKVIDGHRS